MSGNMSKILGIVTGLVGVLGTYGTVSYCDKATKLQRDVASKDSTIENYEAFVRSDANIKKAFIVRMDSVNKVAAKQKVDLINATAKKTTLELVKTLK